MEKQRGGYMKKPMYSINDKKLGILYVQIHEEIFKTRISIEKLASKIDSAVYAQTYDLLLNLNVKCPDNAIKLFEKNKKQPIK